MDSNEIFQTLKAEILRRAEANDACEGQYGQAKQAENIDDLLMVVKSNFAWCWNKQVIDIDLLAKFGEDVLWRNGIYTSGEHRLEFHENASLFFLGSSQATVKTLGSSRATVEARESSQATVETLGSSHATVETLGSSRATVKTLGSSRATVEARESSQATVETWESSQATVETWESSHATVKTRGSSQATVKTRGSSHATVETLGSSIVRDLSTRKIHVPKSGWEIVVYEENENVQI